MLAEKLKALHIYIIHSKLIDMKVVKIIPGLAVAFVAMVSFLGLASCKNETKTLATDSICVKSDSANIADIKVCVDYPSDGKSEVVDSVRAYINNCLHSHFMNLDENGKPLSDVALYDGDINDGNALAAYYCDAYRAEAVKLHAEESIPAVPAPFVHYMEIKMCCDTSTFVSYTVNNYVFSGGAHGSDFVDAATFSTADGHVVGYPVDTAKVKELQPVLRKYVAEYMAQNDNSINAKNVTDYLFIDNDVIPLPVVAPYFTPQGLTFVYQQYEIAPYAVGHPSFTVPYKELASWLTSEAKEIAAPFMK